VIRDLKGFFMFPDMEDKNGRHYMIPRLATEFKVDEALIGIGHVIFI
jgi:hypothetical protein